jgi:hypothetical protein
MVSKIKSSNDNDNKNNYLSLKINRIVTLMFIALLAVVIGAIFISKFQAGKSPDSRYINIEGEAEREVIADTAEWSLYFEHAGEKQSDLNKKISAEKPRVFDFLVNNGISKDEIEFFNYIKEDYHNRKNRDAIRYRMGYCVRIKTKKMEIVTRLKNNLSELFSEDTGIVRNILEVSYSKQAEVEQDLYKEATKNALDKASDLTKFLKIKIRKILKIEAPRFYTTSLVPNVDMMGGHNRLMAVLQNPEGAVSQEMMKRKIKANVSVQVGIR